MKTDTANIVSLEVNLDAAFVPVAMSFVEKSAMAFGLAEGEALGLTLATEELFAYLCQAATPDRQVKIICSGQGYYVLADFSCSLEDFNMRAFNVAAEVSFDDEAGLKEIGLLIASRFVDRMQIKQAKGQGLRLILRKEKAYPSLDPDQGPPVPTRRLETFAVDAPNAEELKLFAHLVNVHYQAQVFPKAFRYPGRVVDMVGSGNFRAALARGADGTIGGGIIWHWSGTKTVECFGPYLFDQDADSPMAVDLLEACLGAIAKTHAVGLINRLPTGDLPVAYFESLGSVTVTQSDGTAIPLTAYFRQMQEDPGTSVWAHADLEPFLRKEYGRLVLPREILPVSDQGETKNPFSVLSAEFDRLQSLVTLRPLRTGLDIEENLGKHLKLFKKEGMTSVDFEMDLAQPWQADFTGPLLQHGFTPRMVLPYAGEGDLVIFQWSGSRS